MPLVKRYSAACSRLLIPMERERPRQKGISHMVPMMDLLKSAFGGDILAEASAMMERGRQRRSGFCHPVGSLWRK